MTNSGSTLEPPTAPEQDTIGTNVDLDLIREAVRAVTTDPYDDGKPSNDVYARVGDDVLKFVRRGIYEGRKPDDLRREVMTNFDVRLTAGDLRLLLASRNPLGRK